MSYLYGDSTPSNLSVNYIEFLRDAVEFCVQVLLADQRIAQGRAQSRTLEHSTVTEVERLQKLGPLVAKAFEGTPLGAADLPTARCAAAILRSANDLVRVESIRMRDALDAEVAKRDAQATQERDGCVKALEALVVKHDPPGTVVDVHLAITGGAHYAGRARMKTGFGLEAMLDLEVPTNNLFERVVRVDRLMERLDIQAPEMGGWLHKEVKRRAQHLERHHVSEFSIGASGSALIKLRVAPDGTGPGFDVIFAKEAPRVRVARIDQQDGPADQPFEVDDDDAKKLLALHHKLAAAVADLAGHRRRLVEAKIDGEAMRTHAKPALLVERLITAMAPVVQEISARSHSPGELVLRRLLSGDRREEIFLSKAELKNKLEPLGDGNRALFDPLWSSGGNGVPAPVSTRPVTAPARLEVPTPVSTPTPVSIPTSAGPTRVMAPSPETLAGAVPPQAQASRHRVTPSLGTPPLNTSTPAASASPAAATPPAASPVRPANESPLGDALRRTLIGTTVQTAAAMTADQASKTPLDPQPRSEPPRKEVAGTIEAAAVKGADPATRH